MRHRYEMAIATYLVMVRPLSPEDGGGFLARIPDLPGCVGDGETEVEAIADVREAAIGWIEAAHDMGRGVPAPSRELEPALGS